MPCPLPSYTSTGYLPARASARARCTSFWLIARHIATRMPYFFSNAAMRGPASSSVMVEYRLRAPSFLACESSRCARSAPR